MTVLSYPRLSASDASELLIELTDAEPSARADLGRSFSGRASKYETAANLAGEEHLNAVRVAVLELAQAHGFPDGKPAAGFDAGLPALLADVLQISPAEAGGVDVWSYLTLVTLPDVALWRWPNTSRNPSYERLIGKPRNVLRRHWWRARLVGPELSALLGEDELVSVVERSSSLGGDPRVAQAVCRAFHEFATTHEIVRSDELRKIKRMILMRDLAKRVLRIGRVVALSTLSDRALTELITELAAASGEAQAVAEGGEIRRSAGTQESSTETAEDKAPIAAPGPASGAGSERVFNQEMQRLGQRAERELGLNTGPLRRLLADFGGVEAARRVIAGTDLEWFGTVTKWGRVDLSVEAVVVKDGFKELFTTEEVAEAQRRINVFTSRRSGR